METTFEPGGFLPSQEDEEGLATWFATYDALAAANEFEKMADLAVFPLNVVSDDSTGNGVAAQWTREQYIATMREVMGGSPDVTMESTRTPHFLNGSLAVVITDATFTYDGTTHQTRYADLLVKSNGNWQFQTMIQSGWGNTLRHSRP